jgi:hypothetical protein
MEVARTWLHPKFFSTKASHPLPGHFVVFSLRYCWFACSSWYFFNRRCSVLYPYCLSSRVFWRGIQGRRGHRGRRSLR